MALCYTHPMNQLLIYNRKREREREKEKEREQRIEKRRKCSLQ